MRWRLRLKYILYLLMDTIHNSASFIKMRTDEYIRRSCSLQLLPCCWKNAVCWLSCCQQRPRAPSQNEQVILLLYSEYIHSAHPPTPTRPCTNENKNCQFIAGISQASDLKSFYHRIVVDFNIWAEWSSHQRRCRLQKNWIRNSRYLRAMIILTDLWQPFFYLPYWL